MTRHTLLTLAGSDPSAGAGLQADLRVAQALGCYGMAVPTALTVQNTVGVARVWPMTEEQVTEQAMAVLDDLWPDAIKVGMLGDEGAARGVLAVLERYGRGNVVVDTVLNSTSGTSLNDAAGSPVFMAVLSRGSIITPNLPEASSLLNAHPDDMAEAACRLSKECGGASVYLKGGHGIADTITDVFYNADSQTVLQMEQPRINTRNTHGTGCTLSTALAAYLAQGCSLDEAARLANAFMHNALQQSQHYVLGHGHGPAFVD